MSIYERWLVAYKHDGSPLDGSMYVHKSMAERQAAAQKTPEKYEVRRCCVVDADVMRRMVAQSSAPRASL